MLQGSFLIVLSSSRWRSVRSNWAKGTRWTVTETELMHFQCAWFCLFVFSFSDGFIIWNESRRHCLIAYNSFVAGSVSTDDFRVLLIIPRKLPTISTRCSTINNRSVSKYCVEEQPLTNLSQNAFIPTNGYQREKKKPPRWFDAAVRKRSWWLISHVIRCSGMYLTAPPSGMDDSLAHTAVSLLFSLGKCIDASRVI